jgi:hypothetical protein
MGGARARRRHAISIAIVASALWAAPSAWAQQPAPVIETPIHSTAPDAARVAESYVSLYAPLPAADGARPAACDRIGYLRFRAADGPTNPSRADAIYVAQPGVFEGAGAFDQVARHTVEAAEAAGLHVEFWAINRRSNCLTDTLGIQAAQAAHDPQVAFNYYYRGAAVNGHRFAGVVSEQDAQWLGHVGLAQTVDDEYSVISQLPPSVRTKKVFCGGHSLGGLITGVFANWDFSGVGDPAFAGSHQCAGYFALETRLELQAGTAILDDSLGDLVNGVLAAISSGIPYVSVAPITPEVEYAVPVLGMAAYDAPNARSTLLSQFPADDNFNTTYGVLLADSWLDFFLGRPDARALNATNETVVGTVFDDNSQPFGFLRASLGAPAGGPLVEKSFPEAYGSPQDSLGGGNLQVSPDPSAATANGPLYTWLNYNQIPSPGPSPTEDPGHPFTTAASEVSDITQFSRTLFQASPALFTEPYFPTALLLDTFALGAGDRSGTLANLRYSDGITQHPSVYVDGGEGLTAVVPGSIPSGPQPQVHVVAQGYNHLDVLTAAAALNNGQPEVASSTLASWAKQVLAAASR